MRIVFVIPFASPSGGHRVVSTYARILQARGHDVWIVSQPPRGPDRSPRGIAKRLLGRAPLWTPPVAIPLGFLGKRHVVLDRARPVEAGDVPDADVVIATWWETAPWVAALPASKGRKAYLLQDYEVFAPLDPARTVATYELGLKMIAVSSYIRDVIAANHGIDGIEMVPNAVDHALFDAPSRPKGDPIRVGFLYTDTLRKNVRLAIDAVNAARRKVPDLRITAFGYGTPSLPLPEGTRYVRAPAQQGIRDLYASCDAWLLTSDREGFGLPILEAMACRTPVLSTRAGAAPDLIDGRNGTILPADAEAFAVEIAYWSRIGDAEWRERSEAAYRTARSYDWDAATDRLLDCLRAA